MTNNTPLNADDELRERVQDICDRIRAGLLPPTGAGAIMQLILADRKKHELQARLEEYQQGLLVGASPEFIGKPMAEERIAELKQELENL